MANSSASTTTIDPGEAAHFGALADDWWNPGGSSAMLHKLNPVRLAWLRARINAHWGANRRDRYPLAGRTALDVGCGAGLLAEPLARLGARVTGVDAAAENIAAARRHAAAQALDIRYFSGELSALPHGQFDLVTAMEVVEHVTDPQAFVAALAARLAPEGLMAISTPNRTTLSRLLLVEGAERMGAVPRGTHDWNRFLRPDELTALLEQAGLEVIDRTGIAPSPSHGFKLGGSEALDYLVAARWRT